MKKIKFLLLTAISLFIFNSCADDREDATTNLNYVGFESESFYFPVAIDGTTELPVSIYTTQIKGSDRSIGIKVNTESSTADPSSYILPESVVIPANTNEGILPLIISDINIGVAGKKLILEFENEEGLFTSAPIQVDIAQSCPGNEAYLTIAFDSWGSETSWILKDNSGNTVAAGGGYSDGDSGISTSFCLGVGVYQFTINDAYGDGGGTAILEKGGNELVNIPGDSYTYTASQIFNIQ